MISCIELLNVTFLHPSLCFFMESAAFKSKFMKQINSSSGSGGMALAMNEAEFALFVMYLKSNVPQERISIRQAASVINPRRACAARVTVVVLCVCVSVHGSNLLVAQLRDKLVILTGSVSLSLQN